ncbi:uncharacterized protein LOC132935785 isoform X2 [Metopolophium dirhodum]|uniref:uncharacterized protein LOC132935785 isoform X2 n=1 Tax=Metopolophium dirhodum TaxID=44670 RepID=UPI00298FE5D8|nr:uncharacterized protein LOC132935785 isoform X2 [Metopolophium dirhodum]
MAPPKKKIKITAGHQGLWALNVCVACKNPLNSTSKILECLHGLCQPCFILNSKVPGHFVCKCGNETELSTGLINYSIACEKFDESTLRNNYMDQKYQKKEYEKYKTNAPCPNCADKFMELYCITCKKFHCGLCHLMHHSSHKFKTINTVMEETRSNLFKNKVDLCGKSDFVNEAKLCLLKDINILNTQMDEIKKKIDRQFEEIRAELLMIEIKMKNDVNTFYKEKLEKIIKICSAIDKLTEKYDFYLDFSESVLKKQNNADLDITHLVNKQLENLRNSFIDEINELDSTIPNIDLKGKLDDTLHKLKKSITNIIVDDLHKYEEKINEICKTMSITSCPGYLDATMRHKATPPTIVDEKQVKIITKYNCAQQERKSLTSLHPDTNDKIQVIQQLHNHYLQNRLENSESESWNIFTTAESCRENEGHQKRSP